MAVLAAPAVNWLATPQPQSAAELVAITSVQATSHVLMTNTILPAPSGSSLSPDNAVGYATSG